MTTLRTTAEAAKALGCTQRTIHRMVEAERITPAMKIPGKTGGYLFEETEVQRVRASRAAEDAR